MNRLKPGDKARVIGNETPVKGNNIRYHYLKIWSEVELIQYDRDCKVWRCKDGAGNHQTISEYDLEPINPYIQKSREVCCGLFSSPEYTQAHSFDDPYIPENTKGGPLHGNCCWECSPILEPIEPVQEEESQKFFPLEFRLNNIGLLVGSVDIEYVVKYDQALQLAESTISRLKSEIEELKRKA